VTADADRPWHDRRVRRGREAIAAYYGQSGKASRETTRHFIIDNGTGDLDNQIAVLQGRDDDE